jgi:lysophospholipase L1-like esterase
MKSTILSLALFAFTVGCGGSDDPTTATSTITSTTSASTTIPEDEDVNSYIPENYTPENPVRVIYMGDSITDGYGQKSGLPYAELLIENDSDMWPDYDDNDLTSSFPSITEVIDVAVGGAVTNDISSSQLNNVDARLDDVVSGQTIVVMTIGGNDMSGAMLNILATGQTAADSTMANMESNLQKMVDFYHDSARFPDGVNIYFTNVYDPTDDLGYADQCAIFFGLDLSSIWMYFHQANDGFRAFAEANNVSMVDMAGHFYGHGLNHDDETMPNFDTADSTQWFNSDCLHPNDIGHHEIRRLFHAAIEGHPLYLEE